MPPQPPATRTRVAAQSALDQLRTRQAGPRFGGRTAHLFGREQVCPASVSGPSPSENTMRRLLATLPADWTAFHAIPLGPGGGAIDHILVGPGGIFTITTRHHCQKCLRVGRRSVTVAGRHIASLPAAEHEAQRVTGVLRERMPLLAPVQPVIALVDPERIVVRGAPAAVKVLDARALRCWLLRLQPVLTEDEIAQAVVLLDSPAIWRFPLHPEPATSPRRFPQSRFAQSRFTQSWFAQPRYAQSRLVPRGIQVPLGSIHRLVQRLIGRPTVPGLEREPRAWPRVGPRTEPGT